MEKYKNSGKLIGTLLVGVLAGAAIGILFAPAKGRKTRRRIKNGALGMAGNIKRKVKGEAKVLRNKAEELGEFAAKKVSDLAGIIK